MKSTSCVVLGLFFALSAMGETWNGTVIDLMCLHQTAARHRRGCALNCAGSGFGLVMANGRVYKLDAAGNTKAVEALKASEKDSDLRAKVTGELKGEVIRVDSLDLE